MDTLALGSVSFQLLDPMTRPLARVHAAMVVATSFAENTLLAFVFGGYTNVPTQELWVYRSTDSLWTLVTPLDTKAPLPSARFGHSLNAFSATGQQELTYALLFGGSQDGPAGLLPSTSFEITYSNELWYIDLMTTEWTLLKPAGALPDGTSYHAAATVAPDTGYLPVKDNILVVSGGVTNSNAHVTSNVYQYNLTSAAWSALPSLPEALLGHSMQALPAPDGSVFLVVFGGLTYDYAPSIYQQTMVFNYTAYITGGEAASSAAWRLCPNVGKTPPWRYFACSSAFGNKVILNL